MRAGGLVFAVALAIAGCAGEDDTPPTSYEKHSRPGTLVIWADDDRADELRPFAEKFAAANGITVEFSGNLGDAERRTDNFLSAVRAGNGPDIYLGEHRDTGEFVAAGAIAPIALPTAQQDAYEPLTIKAATHNGQIYLVPHAITNVVLYRNVAVAPEAPATIEDLVAAGTGLKSAGKAEEILGLPVGSSGDLEHVFPLYSSAGGYLFGSAADGSPDPADLGIGTPASVAAFNRLAALGEKGSGALKRDIDLGKIGSSIVRGRIPFIVMHPFLMELTRGLSETAYAVSPVPGFASGGPARPLVHVHGFFLASAGRNRALAERFLVEQVGTLEVQKALYDGWTAVPALTAAIAPIVAAHPDMQTVLDVARTGVLVPSIPQMTDVWSPFGRAEAAVVSGDDVTKAVQAAQKSING
jgi:arabinogalactan oligomer/maltooligosaccharide transport system substrate-binding protein